MHVHLPKPLHGWREFFGEVGIIVVGVLIALGAEQLVEAWHWREVTGETKAALRDAGNDIYSAMLSRVDMQNCVDHRLTEIGTILARHDAGKPLGIVGPIGMPTEIQADTGVFDMAIANQAFSHMSIADQQQYFGVEGSYRTFQKATDMERDAWQPLQSLHRSETLTPSDWSDIRKGYDRALDVNEILTNDLRGNGDGDWLTPFQGYAKPQNYSLRSLQRVKNLCRSAIS